MRRLSSATSSFAGAPSSSSSTMIKTSMTKVASLRPELEFEVIKVVILREKYLNRLRDVLQTSKGAIDLTVVGLIDTLRDATVNVVETIRSWEQSQLEYPTVVKPFVWNGQGYMQQMEHDLDFLGTYPLVEGWLEFSPWRNPFLLPPELLVYDLETNLERNSYVVFGKRPAMSSEFAFQESKLLAAGGTATATAKTKRRKKLTAKALKAIKSPYNTNIINDPDIIPAASTEHQLKALAAAEDAAKRVRKGGPKTDQADIYETFIHADAVRRMRACWGLLCKANPGLEQVRSPGFGFGFLLPPGSFLTLIRALVPRTPDTYNTLHITHTTHLISPIQH